MTREEMITLNRKRLNLTLKKLKDLSYVGQKELLSKASFHLNGHKIDFKDIDFTKDCIFISKLDLLSVLSYVGLIRLNNVDINDDTSTGLRSRISTDYMLITANDAKMAYVSYDLTEFDPDGWRLENYLKKDLVIWSLPRILGSGTDRDTTTIINSINSIYEMRRFNNKINWMFFLGTEEEFKSIYNLNGLFNTYTIESTQQIDRNKGGKVF